MLTTNVPRPDTVACPDCDKPAYRRQMFAAHPEYARSHGHMLLYDTHAACLTEDEHHAALKRIEGFYSEMHKLEHDCWLLLDSDNAIKDSEGSKIGVITRIDFIQHNPSACGVRTHIVPEVVVRVFGLDAVFCLSNNAAIADPAPPMGAHVTREAFAKSHPGFYIGDLTAARVVAAAKAAAPTVAMGIGDKWRRGDHTHGLIWEIDGASWRAS